MILKQKIIGSAQVIIDLIPTTNRTSRPGYKMQPKYITIHNTGNKKADAHANSQYVDTTTNYVSWHFTVDDKRIYQELPTTEVAWHAGDGGQGPGNRTSIAIEVCEHQGIDWEQAKLNAAKLTALLMREHNIPITNVVPHKKWSGKQCPHLILAEGWDKFVDLVRQQRADQPRWKRILHEAVDMPDEWIDWVEFAIQKYGGLVKWMPQLIEKIYDAGKSGRL